MEPKDQVRRTSVTQRRKEINEDLMIDEDQLYAGPQGQLRQWFDEGCIDDADYMIVGADTFDNTLFPVYTNAGVENTAQAVARLEAGGNKVMEVYDLHADREPQIQARRAWNNEQTRGIQDTAAPDHQQGPATTGPSSQAGLSSFVGGQAKSLPSVPAPGRLGSRFNPRVVSREEQAERRSVRGTPLKTVTRKSLDIGGPALIQGVPPEIMSPATQGQDQDEHGVTEAAAKGFVGGAAAGVQGQALDAADKGFEAALDGPLAGVAGPVTDALNATAEKAPAGSGRPKVVMNPAHVASLAAFDARSDEGHTGSGHDYGR